MRQGTAARDDPLARPLEPVRGDREQARPRHEVEGDGARHPIAAAVDVCQQPGTEHDRT